MANNIKNAEALASLERVGVMLDLARRLEAATPHTLRHNLARRLIESGADLADDHFFQAKSAVVQADRSIVVRIAPSTMEQTADLRSLQAVDFHRRREVTYADQHEAGTTHVQSVVSETSQGKTIFTVTLAPLPQLNKCARPVSDAHLQQ